MNRLESSLPTGSKSNKNIIIEVPGHCNLYTKVMLFDTKKEASGNQQLCLANMKPPDHFTFKQHKVTFCAETGVI